MKKRYKRYFLPSLIAVQHSSTISYPIIKATLYLPMLWIFHPGHTFSQSCSTSHYVGYIVIISLSIHLLPQHIIIIMQPYMLATYSWKMLILCQFITLQCTSLVNLPSVTTHDYPTAYPKLCLGKQKRPSLPIPSTVQEAV